MRTTASLRGGVGRPRRAPDMRTPPSGRGRRCGRRCGRGRCRRAGQAGLSSSTCARAAALSVYHVASICGVLRPLGRDALLGEDRVHRALGLAGAAVDALVGIDEELPVGALVVVDAVHRADGHARDVQHVDTGFGDDIRHAGALLELRGQGCPRLPWHRSERYHRASRGRAARARPPRQAVSRAGRQPLGRAAGQRRRRARAACRPRRRTGPARPSPSPSGPGCGSPRTSRPPRRRRVRGDRPGDVEPLPGPGDDPDAVEALGRRRRTASGPAGGRSSPASAASQASCASRSPTTASCDLEAAVEHVEHDGLAGHEVDDLRARTPYSRMTMLTSRGVALAPGVIGGVAGAPPDPQAPTTATSERGGRPPRRHAAGRRRGRSRTTGDRSAASRGARHHHAGHAPATLRTMGSPLTLRGCARSVRAPRRPPEEGCAGQASYRCTDRPGAPGVAARVTATPTDPVPHVHGTVQPHAHEHVENHRTGGSGPGRAPRGAREAVRGRRGRRRASTSRSATASSSRCSARRARARRRRCA